MRYVIFLLFVVANLAIAALMLLFIENMYHHRHGYAMMNAVCIAFAITFLPPLIQRLEKP